MTQQRTLNPDLWDELLRLESIHTLRYHWVKGHAENPENNRCDELACAAARRTGNPPDPGFRR